MPNIPQTWLDAQTVNATVTGNQSDPNIAQLANGNILVTWTTDDSNGLGSPGGNEVLGRLFDPMGVAIGGEFIVNHASTSTNEGSSDIVALPGGGFIVIYHAVDLDFLGGSKILLEEFSATGVQQSVSATVIFDSASPGFPNYANPHGAASSATSVMIVYDKIVMGGTSVVARLYDPTINSYGAEFTVMSGGVTERADIDVLTNGNYVVVANHGGADNALTYRIMNAAGGFETGSTYVTGTNTNGQDDYDASVTPLTGGGFVITWTNFDSVDTDVLFRVYDAAGVQQASGAVGSGTVTNNNNEAVVTGLSDGSFVIVYDNDEIDVITAAHVSAAGVVQGEFSFDGASTGIAVTDLADGRFAVTYERQGGEIKMEILDTRDSENTSGVYTPDTWQVGTIGDDDISSVAAIVHGHAGNDTIADTPFGVSSLFGDAGNDRINVNSNIGSDAYFGGADTDAIDWAGDVDDGNGIVFNMLLGTAVFGLNTEVMQGFENLAGTGFNDIIIGTAGTNLLVGGAGNDFINGGGGIDILAGGIGNDTFRVDNAGDLVFEQIGEGSADIVRATVNYTLSLDTSIEFLTTGNPAGVGAINLTGNALSQNITGNAGINVLSSGGTGNADTLAGLGGNDTYRVFNAGDVIIEAAGGGLADRVAAAVSFNLASDDSIEFLTTNAVTGVNAINLRGNAVAQTLIGNNGANQLNGAGGSDTMTGGLGADAFMFNTALGPTNVDKITDYNVAADHVLLDNAIFLGLAGGVLAATAFNANLTGFAADASDRITYETDTGFLWFDRDGSGAAFARVQFADLASGLVMSATEFTVV